MRSARVARQLFQRDEQVGEVTEAIKQAGLMLKTGLPATVLDAIVARVMEGSNG